ncbi:YhdP family protein [Piscinibacter defluvii]|uniref:YhdP family protein n=1 Tax=Piscinibacter defluvii TaxID=1796922 RepID=UPI0013E3BADC|nr:YhdP family protein [Piscinibacter defluvii]
MRTLLRVASGLLLAATSLLVIAWLTLHWGILPRIEQWRPQIEARASDALGIPVRIGAIAVRSGSWVPAVELRDVRLLDAQQRPALQLPRVAAALSPRSLLSFELRFAQLLIEGAQLDIRRDADGRIFVAGLDLSAAGRSAAEDDGSALRDWVFEQHEFVVRGGSVRWIDELRHAPPLALTDVQFALRNGLLSHELRLDATPQAEWGQRFSLRGRFRQPLLARAGDWRRWSGDAFAELPHVDVHELRRYVNLPFELDDGEGALRAWVELVDGRPRSGTADVALHQVAVRLAQDVEPLTFAQVQGRVVAARQDEGMTIALQRFAFETGDGLRWPASEMSLAWRQRAGQPAGGGEFRADRLDLALMAQVAGRVPLGEAVRRLLAELQPQGIVDGLVASWDGPLDAPTRYRAKAGFRGLALAAKAASEPGAVGRPGLRNANLQVEASESGGTASLAIDDGAIEFPGVFDVPLIPLNTLAAELAWKIETPRGALRSQVSVQVKDGRFANADAQGELAATWRTGPGEGFGRGGRYPGRLELDGRILQADATQVARYLPLQLPDTRGYLGRAMQGGTLRDAGFRVRGDLWDVPFVGARSAKEGEFRIAGRLEDGTFAYVPDEPAEGDRPAWVSPWPAFGKVQGEFVVDRGTLEIRAARGQLGNVALSNVQGGIRDMIERPVFRIEGQARGPLAEMLRFVNTTPVGEWTGHALARTSATGNADLKLALAMPLQDLPASTVKGSVTLAGNDLRLVPGAPLFGAARGRVDFSQQGFAVVDGRARVLGGELVFDGGSQGDGSLRFNGQGSATAEALRRAEELGPLARLAGTLSGQTSYRASLGFVRGLPEFSLTSSLAGLAIDLPPPLRKPAEASLPLRVQSTLAAGDARDTLRIELGTLLQAQFQRDLSGDTPRVLRGGIGLNEAAPWPEAGVHANLNLGVLRVDPWEHVAERLFPSAPGPGPAGDAGGYLPTRLALRAQELHSGARRFNQVVAGLSQDDGNWRGNVEAEQLNGYVEYRPARAGGAAGRVYARLARLALPKGDAEQVETLLDQQQPTSVPALDIVVDDFELRGKRLGRVEIVAVNGVAGEGRDAVREWRLDRFSVSTPEAQLSGKGRWAEVGGPYLTVPGGAASARRRAVLDFRLEVANGGALLERLGMGHAVRGGKGQLAGQLSWLGSPLALDYGSMGGNINVAIDAGQFLKAEPGAARLLSVLSLQSLPRRLALDFRDVFQEGFAFDNLTGDVTVEQGVARTNNLRMRGVQAVVLMEGSADIARETQDLRVIVVPEINAGTASLAYAAINPALGLGTFLAQVFLRRPLIQAGTREFHVSGSWDDPKVEKVERKPGDEVPDVDAAASAPRPAQ